METVRTFFFRRSVCQSVGICWPLDLSLTSLQIHVIKSINIIKKRANAKMQVTRVAVKQCEFLKERGEISFKNRRVNTNKAPQDQITWRIRSYFLLKVRIGALKSFCVDDRYGLSVTRKQVWQRHDK